MKPENLNMWSLCQHCFFVNSPHGSYIDTNMGWYIDINTRGRVWLCVYMQGCVIRIDLGSLQTLVCLLHCAQGSNNEQVPGAWKQTWHCSLHTCNNVAANTVWCCLSRPAIHLLNTHCNNKWQVNQTKRLIIIMVATYPKSWSIDLKKNL